MGQQQLLLIMLSVIVVGIAVVMGIVIFNTNTIEQGRNELINEATLLASKAQLYYRKAREFGGGGDSFTNWDIPQKMKKTEAGNFSASITSPKEVIITATGNEVLTGGNPIKIEVKVTPDKCKTTIIN